MRHQKYHSETSHYIYRPITEWLQMRPQAAATAQNAPFVQFGGLTYLQEYVFVLISAHFYLTYFREYGIIIIEGHSLPAVPLSWGIVLIESIPPLYHT